MRKKVLVVSDNQYILKAFDKIAKRLLKEVVFDYAISPYSELSRFASLDNISVIDIKDESNIDFIKSNYFLVISAHCKQLFPAKLVNAVRCVNLHPGYNPINRGWYPQVFAIIDDTIIGATIHEMDELLDNGAIIARETVPKYSWDTSLTLYNRVVEKELELLKKNIISIVKGDYNKQMPEKEGRLHLKKDFNELLELDLEQELPLSDFLNKLRALSHGDYKNAYYIDRQSGKRVFVSIELKVDE